MVKMGTTKSLGYLPTRYFHICVATKLNLVLLSFLDLGYPPYPFSTPTYYFWHYPNTLGHLFLPPIPKREPIFT